MKGRMLLNQNSSTQMLGVTQPGGPFLNSVDNGAYVRVADASPAAGGPPSIPSVVQSFQVRNFAKAVLLQTSEESRPGVILGAAQSANLR